MNKFDNKKNNNEIEILKNKKKSHWRTFTYIFFFSFILFILGYVFVQMSLVSISQVLYFVGLFLIFISALIIILGIFYLIGENDKFERKILEAYENEKNKNLLHRQRMVDENIGTAEGFESYGFSTSTLRELGGVNDKLNEDISLDIASQKVRTEVIDDSIHNLYVGNDKLIDVDKMFVNSEYGLLGDYNSEGNLLRYKSGNGVEGIVVGKEYDRIDKNKDGRILISEMYPLSEEEVLDKIMAVDSNFSKTQFKSYVRALFMLLQKAWSNNNYHALRAVEADSLYFEHRAKMEDLISNNCYDKRENIGIRGCLLKDFKIEGDKEVLIVALTARMTRSFDGDVFRLNEVKKSLSVYGDNIGTVPYIMTFMRNKGVKTKTGVPLATSNCSNCGAVINVDDNGVCTYCNTSLVSGEVDWVLVDIKNIELVEY